METRIKANRDRSKREINAYPHKRHTITTTYPYARLGVIYIQTDKGRIFSRKIQRTTCYDITNRHHVIFFLSANEKGR